MKYTVEKKQSYMHVRFSANATEWEAFMEKAYQQNKGKYAENRDVFCKNHKNILLLN